MVDLGEECRVPTVVRPVGIDDAQLSDGGIAQLTLEVLLADKEVIKVHGEPVCALQLDKSVLVEVAEPADGGNRLGGAVGFLQGVRTGLRSFPRFHGVDDVALDGFDIAITEIALEQVNTSVSPTSGRSPCERIWMRCAAESAR